MVTLAVTHLLEHKAVKAPYWHLRRLFIAGGGRRLATKMEFWSILQAGMFL
jgi:hypothetical protein